MTFSHVETRGYRFQVAGNPGLTKTAEGNLQVALGRYQAGVGTIVDALTVRQLRIELRWKVALAPEGPSSAEPPYRMSNPHLQLG